MNNLQLAIIKNKNFYDLVNELDFDFNFDFFLLSTFKIQYTVFQVARVEVFCIPPLKKMKLL